MMGAYLAHFDMLWKRTVLNHVNFCTGCGGAFFKFYSFSKLAKSVLKPFQVQFTRRFGYCRFLRCVTMVDMLGIIIHFNGKWMSGLQVYWMSPKRIWAEKKSSATANKFLLLHVQVFVRKIFSHVEGITCSSKSCMLNQHKWNASWLPVWSLCPKSFPCNGFTSGFHCTKPPVNIYEWVVYVYEYLSPQFKVRDIIYLIG